MFRNISESEGTSINLYIFFRKLAKMWTHLCGWALRLFTTYLMTYLMLWDRLSNKTEWINRTLNIEFRYIIENRQKSWCMICYEIKGYESLIPLCVLFPTSVRWRIACLRSFRECWLTLLFLILTKRITYDCSVPDECHILFWQGVELDSIGSW